MVSPSNTAKSKHLFDTSNFVMPSKRCEINERKDSQKLSCHSIIKRSRQQLQIGRALFPRSAGDNDDTNQWLDELEAKHLNKQAEKWQFDFANGKPLHDPSSDRELVWTKTVEEELPSFYHSVGAPSTSSTALAHSDNLFHTSTMENLLSPQKRRQNSLSPRKPLSTAVIAQDAATESLPPSSTTLLTTPRKVQQLQKEESEEEEEKSYIVSPRKATRAAFSKACAAFSPKKACELPVYKQFARNCSASPTKTRIISEVKTRQQSSNSMVSRHLNFASVSTTNDLVCKPNARNNYCCSPTNYYDECLPGTSRVSSFNATWSSDEDEDVQPSPLSMSKDAKFRRKMSKEQHKTPRKKR